MLSAGTSMAAAQNFRLGVNYSELVPTGALIQVRLQATAVDSQGDIYILASGASSGNSSTYNLVELNPGGDRIIYQNQFTAPVCNVLAVDSSGNSYLALNSPNTIVEKLDADGKTVYTTALGPNATPSALTVDASGRVYLIGDAAGNGLQTTPGAMQQVPANPSENMNAFVARLKASGAVDYATYLGGSSNAVSAGIAVDTAGSAFVTGNAFSPSFPTTPGAYLAASGVPNFVQAGAGFLARLSPDGSALIYSTFTDAQGDVPYFVTVDSSDNVVVALQIPNTMGTPAAASVVQRFNPQGTAVVFSKAVPASFPAGLAVDEAGNTYFAVNAGANFRVLNSLALCAPTGNGALMVLDTNGNILQSSHIAGSTGTIYPGQSFPPSLTLAIGSDSTVYIVGPAGPTYTPTRQLVGSSAALLFLTSFAQNSNGPVVELACVANSASYDSTAMSGGEIVSLFGQGLGPATATEPQVNLEIGFPKQLAGVQVTFNGTPGPLVYVQGNQINAIAPWALQNQIGQNVNVCVVYNGTATNCITRQVVEQHPGVFTVDGFYAAALNQDGSINSASNPASGVVSIFATGLGPISPALPDGTIVGLPLPVNLLQDGVYWAAIRGLAGLVTTYTTTYYGGPAPYEVAGVSQVNFVLTNTYYSVSGEPQGPAPYILQAGGLQVSGPITGAASPPGSNAFQVHQ